MCCGEIRNFPGHNFPRSAHNCRFLPTGDVALKPISSPGAVRHSSSGLDQQTALVEDPLTTDGPLVPLDGPDAGSGKGSPVVEDGEDMETAAMAVVVANYPFSQPDLR